MCVGGGVAGVCARSPGPLVCVVAVRASRRQRVAVQRLRVPSAALGGVSVAGALDLIPRPSTALAPVLSPICPQVRALHPQLPRGGGLQTQWTAGAESTQHPAQIGITIEPLTEVATREESVAGSKEEFAKR